MMNKILFYIILISIVACRSDKSTENKLALNHLKNEKSAYLIQHATNPVDWHPWDEATLQKANEENKLLLISIGYAACHWCHVMEKESFSDDSIAAIMNQHFICIKVDREERPDIDQLYLNACQLIHGTAGWPLNAIAFPDGKPIYAVSYLSKEDWRKMLEKVTKIHQKDSFELIDVADQLKKGIDALDLDLEKDNEESYDQLNLDSLKKSYESLLDSVYGGFKGSPKFPLYNNWILLNELQAYNKLNDLHPASELMLDVLLDGGLFDHVGGGISRYSVDEQWQIPHFEKMLYDNAQFISFLSQSLQYKRDENTKKALSKSLDWMVNEMRLTNGLFAASMDADSEGKEGIYYCWNYDTLKYILGENALLFMDHYGCSKKGNWIHGQNILRKTVGTAELQKKYKTNINEIDQIIEICLEKLYEHRSLRVAPKTDQKIICSWNALTASSLIQAYQALKESKYLNMAEKICQLYYNDFKVDKKLNRTLNNHNIEGFLDDYAFLIQALIDVYEQSYDIKHLIAAQRLMDYCLTHFYNENIELFNYTSRAENNPLLIHYDTEDQVIPSANSCMAINLHRLGNYIQNEDYISLSNQMLDRMADRMKFFPQSHSNWWRLLLFKKVKSYQVIVCGKNAVKTCKKIANSTDQKLFCLAVEKKYEGLDCLKNKFLEGQEMIYLCENNVCKRPSDSIETILNLLNE